jgi:hypothetical protein
LEISRFVIFFILILTQKTIPTTVYCSLIYNTCTIQFGLRIWTFKRSYFYLKAFNFMKKFLFLIGFLAVGLVFTACNSDDEMDDMQPEKECDAEGDCFWCEIDGELFVGNENTAVFTDFGGGLNTLQITGIKTSLALPTINLTISSPQEGTYDLAAGSSGGQYTNNSISTNPENYGAVSGKYTLTTFDTTAQRVVGTFQMMMEDNDGNMVEITNGEFDMAIQ